MSITGDGVKRKKEEQVELLISLDDLIYSLKRLPEEYKASNYAHLLYQMEQVRVMCACPVACAASSFFPCAGLPTTSDLPRSEESRVGQECVSTGRSRWWR